MASPENPRKAWIGGKLLRDSGQWREGEMWLRRAEGVARWIGDWNAQVLALNSRGVLHYMRGVPADAERHLMQALRLAQRCRLPERESEVTHDLFTVSVSRGEYERAEELAARALRLYGENHPNLPKLAHDTAQLWLRNEKYNLALPVLSALLPSLSLPGERIRVLASITRSAGVSGDHRTFEVAWQSAWTLIASLEPELSRLLPAVLVDLGIGAASVQQWERADDALRRAVDAATEWDDFGKAAEAERLLLAVQQRIGVANHRRITTPAATELARTLVESLQQPAPQTLVRP
jgi:tetratricopeptide (TPR) repeat protein